MFANKHAKILIALVCAVLGFMLATQFKTTERQKTINIQRAEDLSDRLKAVEKERDELSKEMEKLQAKAGDEVVAREIVRLKAFAGDFEMHGRVSNWFWMTVRLPANLEKILTCILFMMMIY